MDVEGGASSQSSTGSGDSDSEPGTVPAHLDSLGSLMKRAKMDNEGCFNFNWNLRCSMGQGEVAGDGNDDDISSNSTDYSGGGGGVMVPVFVEHTPLQNPVVLTNLFSVCPPRDLAKFRLVSKEWRHLSLKTWRASSTLKLERGAVFGHLGLYLQGGTSLNDFLEHVEDPRNECGVNPFRRVKFESWIFNRSNDHILRFWDLLGNNLTSLTFSQCAFPHVGVLRGIIYIECPNLRQLSFMDCAFAPSSEGTPEGQRGKGPAFGEHGNLEWLFVKGSGLPVSWLELFQHFSSLRSLQVNHFGHVNPEVETGWDGLLNAIKKVRGRNGKKLPLQRFVIADPPLEISRESASKQRLLLVQQLNLPLESLLINPHPDMDEEFVNDILRFHAGTLSHIIMKGTPKDSASKWKLPCHVELEQLRSMRIEMVPFQSMELLKSTPNLETLSIICDWGEGAHELDSAFRAWTRQLERGDAVKLLKVTRLNYRVKDRDGKEINDLTILAKLMPNVEELEAALNTDDEFTTVCRHWKGLKLLTVNKGKNLTDVGLTGGRLRKEKSGMKWVHVADNPNITDLKGLRSFTCRCQNLTDISVYHGFLLLPNLKSLTVHTKSRNLGDFQIMLNSFGEEARSALLGKGVKLNF